MFSAVIRIDYYLLKAVIIKIKMAFLYIFYPNLVCCMICSITYSMGSVIVRLKLLKLTSTFVSELICLYITILSLVMSVKITFVFSYKFYKVNVG